MFEVNSHYLHFICDYSCSSHKWVIRFFILHTDVGEFIYNRIVVWSTRQDMPKPYAKQIEVMVTNSRSMPIFRGQLTRPNHFQTRPTRASRYSKRVFWHAMISIYIGSITLKTLLQSARFANAARGACKSDADIFLELM